MDILAYMKAKEAQKKMKSLKDRLGSGVKGVSANVKARLEALEAKDPGLATYNRVSDVEANVAANLNRHNLRMNTVVNKNKFALTDLVMDDFGDSTGIDVAKSTGYTFDGTGKRVTITSGQTQAEVVTTAETLAQAPTMVVVSQATNLQTQSTKDADLATGVLVDAEVVDGKVRLEVVGQTNTSENLIPIMTNDTSPSGIITYSGQTSLAVAAYRAFDDDPTSYWQVNGTTNQWIAYEFTSPKLIKEYTITTTPGSQTRTPNTWKFEAWNGSTWVVLDTRSGQSGWVEGEKRVYQITNNTEYAKYRLFVQTNNGNASYIGIGKLEMVGDSTVNLYASSGTYETNALDLGTNYKAISKINSTTTLPAGTTITLSTATSTDDTTFSTYAPVNGDGTITSPQGRYIKIKAVLTGGGNVQETVAQDFLAAERTSFQVDEQIVFDGSAKLKTAYSESMVVDAGYAEAGTLLRKSIDKALFKSIEKVEVK